MGRRKGWMERERERESKATHTHTCMKPSKFEILILPYLRPNVPFVISQSEIKYPHNMTTNILAHVLYLSLFLSSLHLSHNHTQMTKGLSQQLEHVPNMRRIS